MSDVTDTTTDAFPDPAPEPAPEVETPAAPATDEEKVSDLVSKLGLEPTANTLDRIWEWAGHHFGLSRPAPEAPAADA